MPHQQHAIFALLLYQCMCFITTSTTSFTSLDYQDYQPQTHARAPRSKSIICNELTENMLSDILGPAFNSRYMSIDPPPTPPQDGVYTDGINAGTMGKRRVGLIPPFYVEDDYVREIADEPAWSVNHVAAIPPVSEDVTYANKKKRSIPGNPAKGAARQWECESRILWIDLGVDYFPRYLRSVECTSKTCWYGHYKCKPRSFTVKILRRKTGRCTVAKSGTKIGVFGLPSDLRELWVWEERAVNFCCDCAL